MPSAAAKEQFLETYEREHGITMRVLRAYPTDQLDLRPHERCKSARELAWMFALEGRLGTRIFKNELSLLASAGPPPPPPDDWDDLLAAIEESHRDYGALIRATPPEELADSVQFFTAPKTVGDISRIDWLWFLLHDQIHHRGQFSIYLRMAGGKVPSIYGPTADEPWT
jgi:uncharacterized damage-inducible protein DinB